MFIDYTEKLFSLSVWKGKVQLSETTTWFDKTYTMCSLSSLAGECSVSVSFVGLALQVEYLSSCMGCNCLAALDKWAF